MSLIQDIQCVTNVITLSPEINGNEYQLTKLFPDTLLLIYSNQQLVTHSQQKYIHYRLLLPQFHHLWSKGDPKNVPLPCFT